MDKYCWKCGADLLREGGGLVLEYAKRVVRKGRVVKRDTIVGRCVNCRAIAHYDIQLTSTKTGESISLVDFARDPVAAQSFLESCNGDGQ